MGNNTAPQMVITRGIPASGKSTFARQWVAADPENRIEVNRDNIRIMIGAGQIGNREQEATVTRISEQMIVAGLSHGKSVIVSNTNLRARDLRSIIEIGMGIVPVENIEIRDFHINVDEAVKRNRGRSDEIPEQVIRDMAKKFPAKTWKSKDRIVREIQEKAAEANHQFAPIDNTQGPATVVFDIDGTLATLGDRSPYDFTKVIGDTPNTPVVEALNLYREAGYRIVVFSGRSDVCRKDTERWLGNHGITYDELHMRRDGDMRKDSIVKYEMVTDHIEGRYRVCAWYDDRDQVVDMVRQAVGPNICFQVNYGDF